MPKSLTPRLEDLKVEIEGYAACGSDVDHEARLT